MTPMGSTAAQGAPTRRVSLNPATFVQGGLLDDVDVEFVEAMWTGYNYGKEGGEDFLVLGVKMRAADGKDSDQYFSAGNKEHFQPSEDGQWLIPVGDKAAMTNSTNAAVFIASLVACGFPSDRLDSMGINAALAGTKVHVNRETVERKGLIKNRPGRQGEDGKERPQERMIVTKLIALPGQTAAPASKPNGKATQTAAAPAAAPAQTQAAAPAGEELREICQSTLLDILIANGGSVPKSKLPGLAFKALSNHPLKKEAVPALYSDTFLSTADGVVYDGVSVSIA